ncbi:MAG TPA: amidase family protein, partial [Clostridia bacterium]|nr:amidase family protein [Clostridia bacterium]
MKIIDMDIMTMRKALLSKEISSVEVTKEYLSRINEKDRDISAYLYVNNLNALKKSEEIDKKLSNGLDVGVLAGIPMALKDNICTVDMPTTCGSRMLEKYKSP